MLENATSDWLEAQAMDDAEDRTQASIKYTEARAKFYVDVRLARRVSLGSAGFESTSPQQYWSSVLYTRMVVTAQTILKLAPRLQSFGHWDFSAVASITRNLAECYLFFHFLCIDDVSQEVKQARIIMMNFHDYQSRRKLFGEANPSQDDHTVAARKVVFDDLLRQFHSNSYLCSLPSKRQRELIKGDKTPFVQDDVIDRVGLDRANFRFLYRWFSQHTHTGPISFHRMAEQGRGHGVENHQDTTSTTIALDFASDLLRMATADHLTFFPDAEARGTAIEAEDARLLSSDAAERGQ